MEQAHACRRRNIYKTRILSMRRYIRVNIEPESQNRNYRCQDVKLKLHSQPIAPPEHLVQEC